MSQVPASSPPGGVNRKDILCGKQSAQDYINHEGNREFQAMIVECMPRLLTADTNPEQTDIISEILNHIRGQNGTFRKYVTATNKWVQLTMEETQKVLVDALDVAKAPLASLRPQIPPPTLAPDQYLTTLDVVFGAPVDYAGNQNFQNVIQGILEHEQKDCTMDNLIYYSIWQRIQQQRGKWYVWDPVTNRVSHVSGSREFQLFGYDAILKSHIKQSVASYRLTKQRDTQQTDETTEQRVAVTADKTTPVQNNETRAATTSKTTPAIDSGDVPASPQQQHPQQQQQSETPTTKTKENGTASAASSQQPARAQDSKVSTPIQPTTPTDANTKRLKLDSSAKKIFLRNSTPIKEEVLLPNSPGVLGRPWPPGWVKQTYQRQQGATAGQHDSYWFSPGGKKFRSLNEVASFFVQLDFYYPDETRAFKEWKKQKTAQAMERKMSKGEGSKEGSKGTSAAKVKKKTDSSKLAAPKTANSFPTPYPPTYTGPPPLNPFYWSTHHQMPVPYPHPATLGMMGPFWMGQPFPPTAMTYYPANAKVGSSIQSAPQSLAAPSPPARSPTKSKPVHKKKEASSAPTPAPAVVKPLPIALQPLAARFSTREELESEIEHLEQMIEDALASDDVKLIESAVEAESQLPNMIKLKNHPKWIPGDPAMVANKKQFGQVASSSARKRKKR